MSVIDIIKLQNQAEIDSYDKAIELQRRRVSDATKIAENGNVEYLKIEEERLNKLEAKREESARRQLEIDTAVQGSQILVAIAGAMAQIVKGGAVGVITGIGSIVGAVATGFALMNQLNSARPKFWSGAERVSDVLGAPNRSGRDGYDISVDGSERIVPKHINEQLHGIKNEDLPKLLNNAINVNKIVMPTANTNHTTNMTEVEKKLDRLEKTQKETIKAIQKINVKLSVDSEGVNAIVRGIDYERFKMEKA